MDEDELMQTYREMEQSARFHAAEIRGIPMTATEVMGRFILYASVLYNFYDLDDDGIGALLQMAQKTELTAMAVPHTSGKPN